MRFCNLSNPVIHFFGFFIEIFDYEYLNTNIFLSFQENRSYSLWVTAFDGSSIPQRTEVIATITDSNGSRPNVPLPPPFTLPSYPSVPVPPKFTRTTHSTTKATESIITEVTVPDTTTTTTLSPTEKVESVPNKIKPVEQVEMKSNTTVNETQMGNDVAITVIPLVAISGLVAIVAGVIIFVWRKNGRKKSKLEKDDMVSFKISIEYKMYKK